MSSFQHKMRQVADDGAASATRPPAAVLRRRLRVRRTRTAALSATIVVLIGAVSAIAWPSPHHRTAPPATVTTAPPGGLSIDPSTVRAGESVRVSGGACAGRTYVGFSLGTAAHNIEIARTTSDDAGRFSGEVRIPANTAAGATWIWAACMTSPAGKLAQDSPISVLP